MNDTKRRLLKSKGNVLRWKCGFCRAVVKCSEENGGALSVCPSCDREITYPSRSDYDELAKAQKKHFIFRILAATFGFVLLLLSNSGSSLAQSSVTAIAMTLLFYLIASLVSVFLSGLSRTQRSEITNHTIIFIPLIILICLVSISVN